MRNALNFLLKTVGHKLGNHKKYDNFSIQIKNYKTKNKTKKINNNQIDPC